MSKRTLKTIIESTGQRFELFNKDPHLHAKAKNLGIRVGRFQPGDEKLFQEAENSGNKKIAVELLDRGLTNNTSELYFNMPDLNVSDTGSIRSLAVSVYSAEANDNRLLHQVFSKVREDK